MSFKLKKATETIGFFSISKLKRLIGFSKLDSLILIERFFFFFLVRMLYLGLNNKQMPTLFVLFVLLHYIINLNLYYLFNFLFFWFFKFALPFLYQSKFFSQGKFYFAHLYFKSYSKIYQGRKRQRHIEAPIYFEIFLNETNIKNKQKLENNWSWGRSSHSIEVLCWAVCLF